MNTLQLAAAATALGLAACTTMGTGQGQSAPDAASVSFNWTSTDGGSTGTMSARLADGSTFTGPFVQLTNTLRVDALEPMWHGWRRGWLDWGGAPESAFATQYTAKVVANLEGPDNERMRCRFNLNTPTSGMSDGGIGQCQLVAAGQSKTVDASFPRA